MNIRLPPGCLPLEKNASVFGFNRVIHTPSVIASRMGQCPGMSHERYVTALRLTSGLSLVERERRRQVAVGIDLRELVGTSDRLAVREVLDWKVDKRRLVFSRS